MTSILFTGVENRNKIMGFGDFADYSLVCRCKAKEMGCDEIWAVFPKLAGTFKNEDNRYLQQVKQFGITYIKRTEVDEYRGKFDIEHEIYNEIDIPVGVPGFTDYMNYYSMKYGKYETIDSIREDGDDKYILFHVRNVTHGRRNLNMNDLEITYNLFKELLGDKYKYWKIGEDCKLDHLFDKVIPNSYDDIEGFVDLIGKSSFMVGCSSGPFTYAHVFDDVPHMVIGCTYPDPYFNGPKCFHGNVKLNHGTKAFEFMGNKFYGKFMVNYPPFKKDIKRDLLRENLI